MAKKPSKASFSTSGAPPPPGQLPAVVAKEPREQTRFEKKIGLDTAKLKELFDADRVAGLPLDAPIQRLIGMIDSRIYEGRFQSLKDWRIWAAVDEAWGAAFHQCTPTILGKLLAWDRRTTVEQVIKDLEAWGINESSVVIDIPDPTSTSKVRKVLNKDLIFKVLVPIVKAVLTIRTSTLFTERNNDPFFKFETIATDEASEFVGDIFTNLLGQNMVSQFGYGAVLKQCILQTLKYTNCIQFPAEAWYVETDRKDDGKAFTKKEGLRYLTPHPTRMFFDRSWPAATMNTDSGVEWAGFWDVVTYGSIMDNPGYWNRDRITFGRNWFDPAFSNCGLYFTELYPCKVEPFIAREQWSGYGEKRADWIGRYARDGKDKAVFVTNIFMKISPKEYGLGDYEEKIWFRFVVGNDKTILRAEPFPYCPTIYYGCDADANLVTSPSLALEALPWQDVVGNILTQHLITVRQNLLKIVAWDRDQVSPDTIQNLAAQSLSTNSIKWMEFSSRQSAIEQNTPERAFQKIDLGYTDANPLITTLNTVFSVMERALQISAQETATIAGHTQTAKEIETIVNYSGTRVAYSGSFIDDAIFAWKMQLVEASMAFMDDDFVANIPGIDPAEKKALTDMGFKLGKVLRDGRIIVKGKLSAINVRGFFSTRENRTRRNNPAVAGMMMNALAPILSNPELFKAVGVEWVIDQIDRAARLAGMPDDFIPKIQPEASTLAQMREVQAQLMEVAQQIIAAATQKSTQAVTPAIQATTQQVKEDGQAIGEIVQATKATQDSVVSQGESIEQLKAVVGRMMSLFEAAAQPPPQAPPPPPPVVMMPPPVV